MAGQLGLRDCIADFQSASRPQVHARPNVGTARRLEALHDTTKAAALCQALKRIREQTKLFVPHTPVTRARFSRSIHNTIGKMKTPNHYILLSVCLAVVSSPLSGYAATVWTG